MCGVFSEEEEQMKKSTPFKKGGALQVFLFRQVLVTEFAVFDVSNEHVAGRVCDDQVWFGIEGD